MIALPMLIFAAVATRKKRLVRLELPMAASLIGRLGQVHFIVSVLWDRVSHPGQASLRSHFWSGSVGPLHACVGSVVEHLASSRASSGAAAVFGVIHRPRPVRDDPVIDL